MNGKTSKREKKGGVNDLFGFFGVIFLLLIVCLAGP